MPSTTWGPALTAAIRNRRAEPKLEVICRAMRKGILAHPWCSEPAIADHLDTVKPKDRERAAWRLLGQAGMHMREEREALAWRNAEVVSSPEYAAMGQAHHLAWMTLYRCSSHPEHGGPEVLMSFLVLSGTIFRTFGVRYTETYLCRVVKDLRDAGFLTITAGVAFQGFDQARANRYSLLPASRFISPAGDAGVGAYEPGGSTTAPEQVTDHDPGLTALVWRAFEESIERVRALKYLYLMTGRAISVEDMWRDGPPGVQR